MCDDCDWETAIEDIEEMLDGGYQWAEDTLEDIQSWIEEHCHVTEG